MIEMTIATIGRLTKKLAMVTSPHRQSEPPAAPESKRGGAFAVTVIPS
jgi:hypothetical protein